MTTFMTSERIHKLRSITSMALVIMLLLSISLVGPSVAYATETDNESNSSSGEVEDFNGIINKFVDKGYEILRGAVLAICGLMLAFAGIQCFGGTKGVDKALNIAKGCAIAVALVVFAPVIIREVGNWLNDTGTSNPLSEYNTLS